MLDGAPAAADLGPHGIEVLREGWQKAERGADGAPCAAAAQGVCMGMPCTLPCCTEDL